MKQKPEIYQCSKVMSEAAVRLRESYNFFCFLHQFDRVLASQAQCLGHSVTPLFVLAPHYSKVVVCVQVC